MVRTLSSAGLRPRSSARGPVPTFVFLVAICLAAPAFAQVGTPDPSFGTGGKLTVPFNRNGNWVDEFTDLVVQPDGKVVAVGAVEWNDPDFDFGIARFDAQGVLDTTFGANGKVTVAFDQGGGNADFPTAVALQADGKVLVVGQVEVGTNAGVDIAILRLLPSGVLDTSFDGDGKRVTPIDETPNGADFASDVFVQPDGKIVIVGTVDDEVNFNINTNCVVLRLLADGSLDPSFDADGKVIVAFDVGGTLNDTCRAGAVYPSPPFNGEIVIAAQATTNTSSDTGLARLTTGGSLDPSFGTLGKVVFDSGFASYEEPRGLVIDSLFRVLVAGRADTASFGSFNDDFTVARLLTDGALDTSFAGDGRAEVAFDLGADNFDDARGLALQADGRIVVAGSVRRATGDLDFGIARLDTNGSLDTSFGNAGRSMVGFDLGQGNTDAGRAVAVLPDGRIIVGGAVSESSGIDVDYGFTVLRGPHIFSDGFESGDLSAWTLAVP